MAFSIGSQMPKPSGGLPKKPAPTPTPVRVSPMKPEKPQGGATQRVKNPGVPGIRMAVPATFRRGGRVKRTGIAKIHKGERIVGAAGVLGKGVKAKKRMKQAKKEIKRAAKGKS